MAVTRIGIIYSEHQKLRRVTIIPDDDSQLRGFFNTIRKGEGWLEVPIDEYAKWAAEHNIEDDREKNEQSTFYKGLDDYIKQYLGEPKDDTCIAVCKKTGNILGKLKADPTIDKHKDFHIREDS